MSINKSTLENLLLWFLPWILLGIYLGIKTLFVVPYAPLYAFSLGLIFITYDRYIEVLHEFTTFDKYRRIP